MSSLVLFNVELNEKNLRRRDYLLKKLRSYITTETSELLEIGVGNGRFGKLLAPYFQNYFGIDPSKEYIELARETAKGMANVTYLVGAAEKIPFKKTFDVVFFAHSWHFVAFGKAIQEVTRILLRGGLLVIMEPSPRLKKWASPKLRKDSPEFDQDLFDEKIADLKEGIFFLKQLDSFELVASDFTETYNFWLFRKL